MSLTIKRINEDEDLKIDDGENEFQLYVDEYREGKLYRLYWMDHENGYEYQIPIRGDNRVLFLEALRDWANDQIWELRHEEAAA